VLLSASVSQRLVTTGTGSPEGALTRTVGSVYVQSDAAAATSALWLKMTGAGNTGWVQLTLADIAQVLAAVSALQGLVASRAPLLSPNFSGTPKKNGVALATTADVTAGAADFTSDQNILASHIFGA
jgi:hypothetical protein